ncbi:PAS domain S-box protein [Methanofollis fontis]|uniref:PAS domain-containing protein n=1 Tax=Methanofollis fontis TaxID=2052832 RepID=A0A483CS54_9EURY|nr:PAS domain S-box protein [Methanofollis fontis]TAJ45678.1 hypothetical protein CUJ86_02890 [Methanofollis fontis]
MRPEEQNPESEMPAWDTDQSDIGGPEGRIIRPLLSAISLPAAIADQNGTILLANHGMAEITGIIVTELVGHSIEGIFHLETRSDCSFSALVHDMESLNAGTGEISCTLRGIGGSLIGYDVSLAPLSPPGGDLYLFTLRERIPDDDEILTDALTRRRLEVLNRIITVAGRADGLQTLLQGVLEETLHLLSFDAGGIYLLGEAGRAEVVCESGVPLAFLSEVREVDVNSPPYDRIFGEGQAIYTENYPAISPERAAQFGFASLASVPIFEHDQIFGAINVINRRRHLFRADERRTLESIGREIGGAIRRMKIEEELKKQQQNLQTLFDGMVDLIFVISRDGHVLATNRSVQATLGYTAEELKGMPLLNLHVPERRAEAEQNFGEMLAGTKTICAVPIIARDGRVIEVESRVSVGMWEGEEAFFGLTRDVSAAEEAKHALKRRDRILEAVNFAAGQLLGSSSWKEEIGLVLSDLGEAAEASRTYIFENSTDPRTGEILMSQRWEWTEDGVSEEIDNPDLQNLPYDPTATRWAEALSKGGMISGAVRTFPALERAYLEPQGIQALVVAPIHVGRRWFGFIGFDDCHDERHWSNAEIEALQAAGRIIGLAIQREMDEEMYHNPVEHSLIGVYVVQNGRIGYANPALAHILGYEHEDKLLDLSIAELIDPADRERWEEFVATPDRPFQTGIRCRKPDGEVRFLEAIGSPITFRGAPACVGTLMDVTEEKRAREALIESEEKFRAIFNNATDGISLNVVEEGLRPGEFTEVNESLCTMLGYTRAELLSSFLYDIVDSERTDIAAIMERLAACGRCQFEAVLRTSGGERVPVDVRAHMFSLNNRQVILSIMRDIRERIQMEERAVEAFRRIERNMEQFAVLNDQIRNPLQGIIGLAALEDSPNMEQIISLAREIDRIVTLLDQGWVESDKVREVLKRHYGLYKEQNNTEFDKN